MAKVLITNAFGMPCNHKSQFNFLVDTRLNQELTKSHDKLVFVLTCTVVAIQQGTLSSRRVICILLKNCVIDHRNHTVRDHEWLAWPVSFLKCKVVLFVPSHNLAPKQFHFESRYVILLPRCFDHLWQQDLFGKIKNEHVIITRRIVSTNIQSVMVTSSGHAGFVKVCF